MSKISREHSHYESARAAPVARVIRRSTLQEQVPAQGADGNRLLAVPTAAIQSPLHLASEAAITPLTEQVLYLHKHTRLLS